MKVSPDKITDADIHIMQALWNAKKPLTMAEILKALKQSSNWKESTIKTMVRRLVAKGVLQVGEEGVRTYSPLVSQREYGLHGVAFLLQSAFNGNSRQMIDAVRQVYAKDEITRGRKAGR